MKTLLACKLEEGWTSSTSMSAAMVPFARAALGGEVRIVVPMTVARPLSPNSRTYWLMIRAGGYGPAASVTPSKSSVTRFAAAIVVGGNAS